MDTQLVSMLFLTHKSLQSCNKVNSLYVFDALARAAKRQVTKSKLTLPSEPDKGNSVTFLLKMEGVLDGLFKDLLAVADVPEMKASLPSTRSKNQSIDRMSFSVCCAPRRHSLRHLFLSRACYILVQRA